MTPGVDSSVQVAKTPSSPPSSQCTLFVYLHITNVGLVVLPGHLAVTLSTKLGAYHVGELGGLWHSCRDGDE